MNFSRENLIQIWHVLGRLGTEKTTAKGAYAIAKNKRLLKIEMEAIEDTQKNQTAPKGIMEFEQARIELCKEYCTKDEDGNPVKEKTPNGDEVFTFTAEIQKEFNDKLKELQEEHKEALDARLQLTKDFQDFIKEETDVSLHALKFSDLPDNISAEEIEILGELVLD